MQSICTGVAQAGSQQPSHKALGHCLALHFWLSTRDQLCQHTCSTRQVATTCILQAQAKASEHTGKHDVDVAWLSTSGWLGTELQLCQHTCSTRQVVAACLLRLQAGSDRTTKSNLSLSWQTNPACACLFGCASVTTSTIFLQPKSQRTVFYGQEPFSCSQKPKKCNLQSEPVSCSQKLKNCTVRASARGQKPEPVFYSQRVMKNAICGPWG